MYAKRPSLTRSCINSLKGCNQTFRKKESIYLVAKNNALHLRAEFSPQQAVTLFYLTNAQVVLILKRRTGFTKSCLKNSATKLSCQVFIDYTCSHTLITSMFFSMVALSTKERLLNCYLIAQSSRSFGAISKKRRLVFSSKYL